MTPARYNLATQLPSLQPLLHPYPALQVVEYSAHRHHDGLTCIGKTLCGLEREPVLCGAYVPAYREALSEALCDFYGVEG